jgi:putative hydrolase of HD superfamily
MNNTHKIVRLIYEGAALKRLRRTGWQILGDNNEGVGEHSFMTAVIAYFLAKESNADMEKVLVMSIFHDFHEVRTGEVDKLNKFYTERFEDKANKDLFEETDPDLLETLGEYEEKKSQESLIVYEANIIAFLVELKQLVEKGNVHAQEWIDGNITRIKTPKARALADELVSTSSQSFWETIRSELHEVFRK